MDYDAGLYDLIRKLTGNQDGASPQRVTNLGMVTQDPMEGVYKSMPLPDLSSPNIEDRRGMPGKWNQKFHDVLNEESMQRREQPRWLDWARGYNEYNTHQMQRPANSFNENMRAVIEAKSGVTPKDNLSFDNDIITNQFPAKGPSEWDAKAEQDRREREGSATPVTLEDLLRMARTWRTEP